jgi:hypothetical protein
VGDLEEVDQETLSCNANNQENRVGHSVLSRPPSYCPIAKKRLRAFLGIPKAPMVADDPVCLNASDSCYRLWWARMRCRSWTAVESENRFLLGSISNRAVKTYSLQRKCCRADLRGYYSFHVSALVMSFTFILIRPCSCSAGACLSP